MKCQSCTVAISQEYTHAIKNNQCPACGEFIMKRAQMESFLSLKSLLAGNFPDWNTEPVAAIIMANFELKQISKQELTKPVEEGIIETEESMEVTEDEVDPDVESDEEYKKIQKAEAKQVLEKMRAEALDEAKDEHIADEWGLGNANGVISPDEVNQIKKKQSVDNVLSGTRGAFRR